jgi:hypothetical protein
MNRTIGTATILVTREARSGASHVAKTVWSGRTITAKSIDGLTLTASSVFGVALSSAKATAAALLTAVACAALREKREEPLP